MNSCVTSTADLTKVLQLPHKSCTTQTCFSATPDSSYKTTAPLSVHKVFLQIHKDTAPSPDCTCLEVSPKQILDLWDSFRISVTVVDQPNLLHTIPFVVCLSWTNPPLPPVKFLFKSSYSLCLAFALLPSLVLTVTSQLCSATKSFFYLFSSLQMAKHLSIPSSLHDPFSCSRLVIW